MQSDTRTDNRSKPLLLSLVCNSIMVLIYYQLKTICNYNAFYTKINIKFLALPAFYPRFSMQALQDHNSNTSIH